MARIGRKLAILRDAAAVRSSSQEVDHAAVAPRLPRYRRRRDTRRCSAGSAASPACFRMVEALRSRPASSPVFDAVVDHLDEVACAVGPAWR